MLTISQSALPTSSQLESERAWSSPIAPPSEPMQYRALGLVSAQYIPSANSLSQGILVTSDSTIIDARVLGRALSRLKKIDLSIPQMWVCYPKTREHEPKLQLLIQGIWTKHLADAPSAAQVGQQESPSNYFSIRGEVVRQNQESQWVLVQIKRVAHTNKAQPRAFKLKLQGELPVKAVKQFWDFQVKRQGQELVLVSGEKIADLGKKKHQPPSGNLEQPERQVEAQLASNKSSGSG